MTTCNHCGAKSRQPPGDGCHTCQAGTMESRDYTAYITKPDGRRIANLFAIEGQCAVPGCNKIADQIICDDHWFHGWEAER